MLVTPFRTRIFNEHESLESFIFEHLETLPERSVLVITSKIVALAEGRTADPQNESDRDSLIASEGTVVAKTKYVTLTIKDNLYMANAGIDASNANGKYVLLPRDSYISAKFVRSACMEHYAIKELGVIISDSRTVPLRRGVTAVALGYAGIKGIKNYTGELDIFGRPFQFESTNVVDSLATASALVMGEGAEQQPLAVITDIPAVVFTDTIDRTEAVIAPDDDMYQRM
jgi:F420-0:gamma-glutamyl ligase